MKVPSSWRLIKEIGVDFFVGRITLDTTDTLYFDLGMYSSTLDERSYFIESGNVYLINDEQGSMLYYGRADTTIDHKLAKIVWPKKNQVWNDRYKY